MPKNSILGNPSVNAGGAPKNGFPVSQDYTFTAGAGMLLPTYKQFLNYGEKVKGVPRAFIRTEPLLAPAMADLDVYVDVFFVPMRHLISMFDSWFTQVDDDQSALWDNSKWTEHLPVLSATVDDKPNAFGWMTSTIFNTAQLERPERLVSDPTRFVSFGFGAHRLVQHLGYNAQSLFVRGNFGVDPDWSNCHVDYRTRVNNTVQPAFCPYYFMAYQKIYYDYYRDSRLEPNNVKAYNIDDVFNSGEETFAPANTADKRLGMFALRYRYRSKDYFTHIHRNPFFNTIGMLPNAKYNLARLNNWLTAQEPNIYENGANGNSVYLNEYSGGTLVAGDPEEVGDFSTYPDVDGYSNIDEYTLTPGDAKFNNVGPYLTDSENVPAFHSHGLAFPSYVQDGALSVENGQDSGISLAQVRAAFALDKLYRLSSRAGKHADDQILAQFGVKIPQGISGEVYHIKQYHTMVHIGEVIQSATTVDSQGNDVPLGELAGRGVAMLNQDEPFSFTAPSSGILMSILSVAPRYKYAFTIEKDGMKVYLEDFFKPATDNLGMQPLFFYEALEPAVVDYPTYDWQYRYMEDKLRHDRVSMVFATNGKNPWSFNQPARVPNSGVTFPSKEYSDLKVMPFDTNNMFVTEYIPCPMYPTSGSADSPLYTGSPAQFLSWYLRDPFTIDFSMQCTKVSQMSTYGEPELGGL